MFRITLYLLLLASCPIFAASEKVTYQAANVLLSFFHTALKYTPAGYVLFDQKPLCVENFCEQLCYFEPSDWHEISISLCAAKEALKTPLFSSGNIFIHIDEKNELILFINRKLFLETVQDSLPLFQYILGPVVTPESLLKEILSPDQSFFSVLKEDKVLMGIVLGYGVQNSLYVSRQENILNSCLSADIPPSTPKVNLCTDDFEKQILLFFPTEQAARATEDQKYLEPSFGFSSLKTEAEELEKKLQTATDSLDNGVAPFTFGWLKEDTSNQQFVKTLETTQDKIQTLLQSSTFLEEVLEKFAGNPVIIEKREPFPLPTQHINLNVAAAKLLKGNIEGFDTSYNSFFAKGLLENMEDTLNRDERLLGFPECIRNIRTAKKNVEQANKLFAALKKNKSYSPLLNSYLYYKIIEGGQGKSLEKETSIYLDFDVFDPTGKCLRAEVNITLDLQNTIPGFAHGLRGMKIGEKREIYIHPALAYGVHTFLEKGIYLRAVVRLLDIHASEGEIPALAPVDLAFICSDQFQQKCEENLKQILGSLGTVRGRFFKSCPGFDLTAIAEAFLHLKKDDTLSKEEIDALNQVFWNFYFAPKSTKR